MVSILDVVPAPEIVRVRGKDFEVNGLTLEDLAGLVARFPEVAPFFAEAAAEGENVSPMAFLKASPLLAARVIGFAIRQETPEEIAGIRKLPMGDSLALLLAVKKGSLPDGTGPLEEIMAMAEPLITKVIARLSEAMEASRKARSTASAAQQPASSGEETTAGSTS